MEFQDLGPTPTNDEIYASPFSSHQAYHRARRKASKLQAWSDQNEQRRTEVEPRGSRLPGHLDNPYVGSYTQRALQPVTAEVAQVKPSLIPALSPSSFKDAKDAYEWYQYPHTLSDDRRKWVMKFAVALRLALPQETWQGLDDTRKTLINVLIESEDARTKFSN